MRLAALALIVCLGGCSGSSSADKQAKQAGPAIPPHFMASNTDSPVAKYVELVGLRINETSPGKLQVRFGVVNHSEADLDGLKLIVNLGTTAAKPGEPPLIALTAMVPKLGASELKDVSVDVPTKLRVYELPDWQFLKADFQITETQP